MARSLAQHEHHFRLVVEAVHRFAPRHVCAVAGQAGIELDEAGGFSRHFLDQVVLAQFLEVGAVVLADAEKLVSVGNRGQETYRGLRSQRRRIELAGILAGECQHGAGAGEPGFAQGQQAFHGGGYQGLAVAESGFTGDEVKQLAFEQCADTDGARVG